MPSEVTASKVLAVEGKDECVFLQALLGKMGIQDVELKDVGGSAQFQNKFPALVRSTGFRQRVHVIGIVRDAEHDASSAFESACDVVKKVGFTPPATATAFSNGMPKVGIFITPGDGNAGMLEDLCLQTVGDTGAFRCAQAFVQCAALLGRPPGNMQKATVQAYLAAMPEIVPSLGLGAQKGYWDLDSEKLEVLREFFEFLR